MSHVTLTDVEWMNFQILTGIHSSLQADMAEACSRYGLSAAQAEHLRSLHLDQLWSLIIHIGDTSLFPPRTDLLDLIQAPRILSGPIALVHGRASAAQRG